jgi:hypothetical protein
VSVRAERHQPGIGFDELDAQAHVANDGWPHRSNRVGDRRMKSRRELLGDRAAANHLAPLEHGDVVPRLGEIEGAGQSVVAGTDDENVAHREPAFVSLMIRIAALRPGAPMMPPPGWVAEPHM